MPKAPTVKTSVQEHGDACRWSPNQLRHTCATQLRAKYGIELTRTVLGHSDIGTSEIYAERDLAAAERVMREVKIAVDMIFQVAVIEPKSKG
ncbi:tyrosine-type recombinase/integrase [Alienimonas californiensis]|uniref:Site-specific tyrosine recombinase XerC n=1 Tax=Alienimonas californiensis TaxID=2527989 RepID=A0A517P5F1_9PLAN|nr:tyrosine-type recombinase/integrase [Alienimonas californiensis]QDT14610.1 site-specific tyrosine recombinase XerC [Alienimonas californiensis]